MKNHNDTILSVRDLVVEFKLMEGVVRALDGVSFDIKRGTTLGVIGESGCGKSVTAQSIMQLLPQPPARILSGEIWLYPKSSQGAAQNLLAYAPSSQEMRKARWNEISMVFQEPMTALSPVHSIGSQIIEAIRTHEPQTSKREARERAISLLQRVGIAQAHKLVDSYSFQFSGGMRQRAMIAMSLACHPQLLIADEPTTALDVTIEVQILSLIRQLQAEEQMSVMYISHDLTVVGEVADEVMVMYLGVVVEVTDVKRIFENPLHPYTRALASSIPTIDGELTELKPISGDIPSPFARHTGCRFFSRCAARVPGKCDVEAPPLIEVEPGHHVRCFLYEEAYAAQIAAAEVSA